MKCPRCDKWLAQYHVRDRKGAMVASCVQCLTPAEKQMIDPKAVDAKAAAAAKEEA